MREAAPPVTLPAPELNGRYGILGPLRNNPRHLAPDLAPNLQPMIVPDEPASPVSLPPGQLTPGTLPAALGEHSREIAPAPESDPAAGAIAGDLSSVAGLLLNILDAIRDLAEREPLDVQIALSAQPISLNRHGRRHIILWLPSTPPTVTVSGILPTTTLTLKAGWNVLDVPDGTMATASVATNTYYRCLDEVPPGLFNQ